MKGAASPSAYHKLGSPERLSALSPSARNKIQFHLVIPYKIPVEYPYIQWSLDGQVSFGWEALPVKLTQWRSYVQQTPFRLSENS